MQPAGRFHHVVPCTSWLFYLLRTPGLTTPLISQTWSLPGPKYPASFPTSLQVFPRNLPFPNHQPLPSAWSLSGPPQLWQNQKLGSKDKTKCYLVLFPRGFPRFLHPSLGAFFGMNNSAFLKTPREIKGLGGDSSTLDPPPSFPYWKDASLYLDL